LIINSNSQSDNPKEMKYRIFGIQFLAVTLFIHISLSGEANGALIVSNWNLTTTSLTFDINGTLQQGYPGTHSANQVDIFIGELFNSNWINSGFLTGFIIDRGSTVAGSEVYAYAWNGSPDGDLAYLRYLSRWQNGNLFNYTVSFSGNFNPSGVDATNLDVFWGLAGSRWLQPELQVGTVIPEPSSALFLGFSVWLALIRGRKYKITGCRERKPNGALASADEF